MARETDFLDLYRILGLNPGCSLAEFKQAYRRRVSVLHPDRRSGDGRNNTIAAERLQQLTALYGAAIEFERRHGRLPGAAQGRQSPDIPIRPATVQRSAAPPPSRRSPRLLVALVAAIALAWLLWNSEWPLWNNEGGSPASESRPVATLTEGTPGEHATAASPSVLELGMDADVVRAIQGEPMIGSTDHWEYGPSWIRFENGKVVDWYSSPLNPLKTTTMQPAHARD
ncbi:J domain-containing protein [Rhodanobacter sp. C01]|uniref:J domain-containing protein n=1 Tax=Rhodanobacter sp. C01 TaxID=1945856 RepID=UPI001C2C2743|nr:J domain-containing protein [Rhodanobacter sp. C01]